MKTIKTKLDYDNGENVVPEGSFRISASGIARFITDGNAWWRENLLGESGFTGSTASVLGTLVHYCAERYALTSTFSDDDKSEVANYLLKHTDPEYKEYNPDVDKSIIDNQFPIMAQNLINSYVSSNMPTEVEPFVAHEIKPNIFVGGSIDALEGVYINEPIPGSPVTSSGTIVDYKTTSMIKLPDTIKYEYRLQLLTYAWVLKQKGINIDRIRIVYVSRDKPGAISEKTGKQLKSYPSQVKVLTENILEQDLEYIDGIINLIADSIERWNSTPEDRYLLAKDYRLKIQDTNLFK